MTKDGNETVINVQPIDPLRLIACRSRRAGGFARQAPRRAAEDGARRRAAAICEDLARQGHRCCDVAHRLHLSRRTLNRWRALRQQPPCALPRGRPCKESPPIDRRKVLALLAREGPHLGLPTLRAEFSGMPRCELRDLQAAYRQHFRMTHRRSTEELTWHRPGRVWAMDHVHPPNPINGVHDKAFSIRDLASGQQLAWLPVADETAAMAVPVLESLINEHGAPLVIKSDNGSAFQSDPMQRLLEQHRIVWLPSPPRMPQYNGGCEAANGSMRRRTNYFADRAGGRDYWTSDSLEAACRQANELTRPHGHLGPTPSELWASRTPITSQERDQLAAAIAGHRQRILAEWKDHIDPQNKNHQHQVHRQAVRRALLEVGLLTVTRRSIPLPIKRQNRDKIS
jgi:transposase InsO family protein